MFSFEKAIKLREKGELKESNLILVELVKQSPDDAYINYQCAWSYDVLGQEVEAVNYYNKAIELGLRDDDLCEAYLGLGSTLRSIGEYKNAEEVFLKAMSIFPEQEVLKVFYAMVLYNLNEHEKAMELLLAHISNYSSESKVTSYSKSIEFYSNKLSQK